MSFVVSFICFPAVQNCENQLRFERVKGNIKVGTFFDTQCSNRSSEAVVCFDGAGAVCDNAYCHKYWGCTCGDGRCFNTFTGKLLSVGTLCI